MNNVRILSCFAGFTVSVSLFASPSTGNKTTPLIAAGQGETGVVLRVLDAHGATIAKAHVTVRDERGRAIASGMTNQDGVLGLPRLAVGSYVFSVSTSGTPFAEFQSFFCVGPGQVAEIEVALKDRCDTDYNLNCDDYTATPPFVDLVQQNSILAIAPYPILHEPASRRPSFFKRLLSRFHHQENGK